MKSILFLVKLPPPVNGATLMNKSVVESGLLSSKYRLSVLDHGLANSMSDFGTFRLRKFYTILRVYIVFVTRMIVRRPDCVYITIAPGGVAFIKDSILVAISRLFNTPTILHIHGRGIERRSQNSKIYRAYYRAISRQCYFVCLSDSLAKDIQYVHDNKPRIIPNGIRSSKTSIATKCLQHGEKIELLYLSNYHPMKGVIEFIKSVGKLCQVVNTSIVNAHIVGDETRFLRSADLNKLIDDMGLRKIIHVHGPLYGKEKFKLMSNSDIFVFPTKYENEAFPLVILEAMEAGMMVVSTDVGGIPDIVLHGKTGFIVKPNDVDTLVQHLEYLVENISILRKMKEASRLRYEKYYTYDVFEQNMANLFKEVVGG